MPVNPKAVAKIIYDTLGDSFNWDVNNPKSEDIEFAQLIIEMIMQKARDEVDCVEETTLYAESESDESDDDDYDDPPASSFQSQTPASPSNTQDISWEFDDIEMADISQPSVLNVSEYIPSPDKSKTYGKISDEFSLDEMKRIADEYKKYSWNYVSKRHAKLRNDHKKLKRILEFLENHGDRHSKLRNIKNSLYTKFRNERSGLSSVHNWHLELWANEINQEICLPNFKASSSFIENFKRQFKISSRKITKFYTKATHVNEELIRASATAFVRGVNDYIERNSIKPEVIWNTDQSGFAYELVSARTLTNVGERDTLGLAQNMNSLSHSYTIQVHISAAGKLGKKLFVCFQEPKGFFGTQISEKLKKPPCNIIVQCTKSGKMTKEMLEI